MWQYQNTDELYHHGILGMRWGHRKVENKSNKSNKPKVTRKEYNKEYSNLINKFRNSDPRAKQAMNIAKQAISYGRKNKLNMDDGGGGSRKAGEKYLQKWERYDKLVDSIDVDAKIKAQKYLKNKYGHKRVKQIGIQNTAASLAAIGTIRFSNSSNNWSSKIR